MPYSHPTAPLGLSSFDPIIFADVDFDCNFDADTPSPYPPSSPSVSDSEDEPAFSNAGIRSAITVLPEAKLRAIMMKLVDSNPHFQRAVMKEISSARTFGDPPPTPITPTAAKPHKRRRSKSRRNLKNLSVSTRRPCTHSTTGSLSQMRYQPQHVYHPGRLEAEVYEFLSGSPDECTSFHDVRTITMWSCCEEDEWSPGCASAPTALALHIGRSGISDDIIEFKHADVYPDSDIEQRS